MRQWWMCLFQTASKTRGRLRSSKLRNPKNSSSHLIHSYTLARGCGETILEPSKNVSAPSGLFSEQKHKARARLHSAVAESENWRWLPLRMSTHRCRNGSNSWGLSWRLLAALVRGLRSPSTASSHTPSGADAQRDPASCRTKGKKKWCWQWWQQRRLVVKMHLSNQADYKKKCLPPTNAVIWWVKWGTRPSF